MLLAGIPRKRTEMLPVPDGGAALKVSVRPDVEYVVGSCKTPETATMIDAVLAGAAESVNAVCEPLPLNVSVKNATDVG
jgi:hypothetical protein